MTPPPPTSERDYHGFQRDLEALINRYSLENGSNTPDFILAAYLIQCLHAYETLQTMRDGWYGVQPPYKRATTQGADHR